MVIIEVQVATECGFPLRGTVVREAIDAFAKKRLDESFCFAVGSRRVRSCESVTSAEVAASLVEVFREVAAPVVGQYASGLNIVFGEPMLSTTEKGRGGDGIVGRQHLDVCST